MTDKTGRLIARLYLTKDYKVFMHTIYIKQATTARGERTHAKDGKKMFRRYSSMFTPSVLSLMKSYKYTHTFRTKEPPPPCSSPQVP
jgi:hypothetical protein